MGCLIPSQQLSHTIAKACIVTSWLSKACRISQSRMIRYVVPGHDILRDRKYFLTQQVRQVVRYVDPNLEQRRRRPVLKKPHYPNEWGSVIYGYNTVVDRVTKQNDGLDINGTQRGGIRRKRCWGLRESLFSWHTTPSSSSPAISLFQDQWYHTRWVDR